MSWSVLPEGAIQKSIVALLGVLIALFGGAGVWFSLSSTEPWATSQISTLLLFGGITVTGMGLLAFAFRPSMAGFWLLNVSTCGTVWLNGMAYLAVRDSGGLAQVSLDEWLRIAAGTLLIAGFAFLAIRARRRARAAILSS